MEGKKVTLLIPCFNEESSLPFLYDNILKIISELDWYKFEILFINDGSKDNTIKILDGFSNNDNRVHYLDLSRNFGKEAALMAAFDFADGDCVIIMDADLQHPPSLIPEMLKLWEEGYEDVYAKRENRGKEGWLRKKLSLAYYKILKRIAKIDILPNVGDFRLLDKKCIMALRQLREKERYTKGLYCWIGFKKKEILFVPNVRIAGKSNWSYSDLFSLAINGITSFTVSPLRISSVFGFLISLIAFIYLVFILIRTLVYGEEVKGFPTLIIIILFLGGIQLISLGIIGEYIGKIFNETKNRPIYVIRKKKI